MSVVLPAYNEVDNIEHITNEAVEVLGSLVGRFEVIIVNDGSQDGTGDRADALAQAYSQVRVVQHTQNRGYGAALRSGFEAATLPWKSYTNR